jgi:hypothetical protein
MAFSRALLLWGSKPGSSLDSDRRAAMVDLFNLPDRFGQWQKAITSLPQGLWAEEVVG